MSEQLTHIPETVEQDKQRAEVMAHAGDHHRTQAAANRMAGMMIADTIVGDKKPSSQVAKYSEEIAGRAYPATEVERRAEAEVLAQFPNNDPTTEYALMQSGEALAERADSNDNMAVSIEEAAGRGYDNSKELREKLVPKR